MRVVIIGNGIISNLAALYLRKRLPDSAKVIIVGPKDRGGAPIVGESTIEITARFLENQLGLGQYLRENHHPKYALTYYFKLDLDNPDDRTYSVHCNERAPVDLHPLDGWEGPMARPPSWQLNRMTFDQDIKEMVDEKAGIERIEGRVRAVNIDPESGHQLEITGDNGNDSTISADWLIDASGRRRLLARKLGIGIKQPEGQRNCFWFRLADFDRSLLSNLNALGPQPPEAGDNYHYDRYFSTHHFMGHGNWIWLIPMKPRDGSELISIGLSSRPDVYEHDVQSMDDFIEHVAKEHPVVTDLVKSGRVVDTNRLRNYHYIIDKVYSPDRWGIIGDAAFAPDPLFSNGLAFSSIQIEQVGEMIARDMQGKHSPGYVNSLSDAFLAPVRASQGSITEWYKSMDDAFVSSLRLHWIEVAYFYMLLPLVVNHCHYDPDRMALWKILQFRADHANFDIPPALLEVRKMFEKPTPNHFIYRGKSKVNPRALEKLENVKDIIEQISEGSKLRTEYTKDLITQIRAHSNQ